MNNYFSKNLQAFASFKVFEALLLLAVIMPLEHLHGTLTKFRQQGLGQ